MKLFQKVMPTLFGFQGFTTDEFNRFQTGSGRKWEAGIGHAQFFWTVQENICGWSSAENLKGLYSSEIQINLLVPWGSFSHCYLLLTLWAVSISDNSLQNSTGTVCSVLLLSLWIEIQRMLAAFLAVHGKVSVIWERLLVFLEALLGFLQALLSFFQALLGFLPSID